MSEPCEQCTCVIPEGQRMGWCERHQCKKTAHWVMLCQTRADYRALWDQRRGPGQVKPGSSPYQAIDQPSSGGVGTELKLVLRGFGIVAGANCKCEQRAREMDSNGIEWCKEHLEEIVDWLEEEAKNRSLSLLFTRTGAKILVRRAIKNARRKRNIMADDPVHRLADKFEMAPAPEAFQ